MNDPIVFVFVLVLAGLLVVLVVARRRDAGRPPRIDHGDYHAQTERIEPARRDLLPSPAEVRIGARFFPLFTDINGFARAWAVGERAAIRIRPRLRPDADPADRLGTSAVRSGVEPGDRSGPRAAVRRVPLALPDVVHAPPLGLLPRSHLGSRGWGGGSRALRGDGRVPPVRQQGVVGRAWSWLARCPCPRPYRPPMIEPQPVRPALASAWGRAKAEIRPGQAVHLRPHGGEPRLLAPAQARGRRPPRSRRDRLLAADRDAGRREPAEGAGCAARPVDLLRGSPARRRRAGSRQPASRPVAGARARRCSPRPA